MLNRTLSSPKSTTWATMAKRSAREQRRAIEARKSDLALTYAVATSALLDAHIATIRDLAQAERLEVRVAA